jgi:transposase
MHHGQPSRFAGCPQPAQPEFRRQPAQSDLAGRHNLRANGEGWLYLAAVLDLFTKKIVGRAMRDHLPTLDYVKKRKADGNGKMEIIRCLKRLVAREIFGHLCGAHER